MTTYRIMYWHDIPFQIKAQDENGTIKQILEPKFNKAINSASIARQKFETNAYAAGWNWGKKETTHLPAKEITNKLAAQLNEQYSEEDLRQAILKHAKDAKTKQAM